jgi:hypothetical protein
VNELRRTLERYVGPLILVVSRLPRAVPFLVVVALLLGGLAVQGVVGGLLLLVLAAALGSLLLLSWPVLEPGPRLLRLSVVALVAVRAGTFLLD